MIIEEAPAVPYIATEIMENTVFVILTDACAVDPRRPIMAP